MVIRNGVQTETLSAAEMREAVEATSAKAAAWCEEEIEDDDRFESWPSWVATDRTRSYRSPYADDAAWPKSITRQVWAGVVGAWAEVGEAGDVLDALTGGETKIPETARRAVETMEGLVSTLLYTTTPGVFAIAGRSCLGRGVLLGPTVHHSLQTWAMMRTISSRVTDVQLGSTNSLKSQFPLITSPIISQHCSSESARDTKAACITVSWPPSWVPLVTYSIALTTARIR
jgi:hypothetical protein